MSEPATYTFRTNTLHGKVVGGFVGAVGVVLVLVPESVVAGGVPIGLVMIAIGAAFYLAATRTASATRPRLVVSDEGVWHRDWGLDVVPWGEIARVFTGTSRFKTTLCVELKDPEGFVADLPPAVRERLKTNPLTRLPVLRILPTTLKATVDDLLAALRSGL